MRKITCALSVCIMLCMLLSSCYGTDIRNYIPGNWDPYDGERPSEQIPSKWVAEEIDCWFEVTSTTVDEETETVILGEISYMNAVYSISVRFDPGRSMFVYDANGEMGILFRGPCTFDEDKFVLEIDEDTDILFDGQYEKVTFCKVVE